VLDEPHRQAGLFDPRRNEDNLRLLNVALTHKFHMHEKLVFIDDELLWSGSLNALGNLVPHLVPT
jgi:hypothetical protein